MTDILLDVKIMPLTTTCKLQKFFVIIYKIGGEKKSLKCTIISNVAFLIMHKSKMNYNITNKYREDVMPQIYISPQHVSAYTAIFGRLILLMGGTQLLHI